MMIIFGVQLDAVERRWHFGKHERGRRRNTGATIDRSDAAQRVEWRMTAVVETHSCTMLGVLSAFELSWMIAAQTSEAWTKFSWR
jgi:hypothetical protein